MCSAFSTAGQNPDHVLQGAGSKHSSDSRRPGSTVEPEDASRFLSCYCSGHCPEDAKNNTCMWVAFSRLVLKVTTNKKKSRWLKYWCTLLLIQDKWPVLCHHWRGWKWRCVLKLWLHEVWRLPFSVQGKPTECLLTGSNCWLDVGRH